MRSASMPQWAMETNRLWSELSPEVQVILQHQGWQIGAGCLSLALGAELSEGRGSRMRAYLEGARAVFHRAHPQKETEKGALKSERRFVRKAGIQCEE